MINNASQMDTYEALFGPYSEEDRKNFHIKDEQQAVPANSPRNQPDDDSVVLLPEGGAMDLSVDRPNIRRVLVYREQTELRISAVPQCLRQTMYRYSGQTPTDPIPENNIALMTAGQALEPVVKQMLSRQGWTINDHPPVQYLLNGILLTGNTDGIIYRTDEGKHTAVVLEVKTRSGAAARYAWDLGVERSHPQAVWQAALYSMAIFGEIRDVIIATMNREDGEVRCERIPADRVETAYHTAVARVQAIADAAASGQMPVPEYDAGHAQCKSCPYRTACGNHIAPDSLGSTSGTLTDEELRKVVAAWVGANANAQRSNSPEQKTKRDAADIIKAHMIASGNQQEDVVVDGQTYRLKLSESHSSSINREALNELVAPEVREQVVEATVRRTMRITPVKGR